MASYSSSLHNHVHNSQQHQIANTEQGCRSASSVSEGCSELCRRRWMYFLMKFGQCLDIWRQKKRKEIAQTRTQGTNLKESSELQRDMLTCLMSVGSDKQYSQKGPTASQPDISPPHLIDKHFSGTYPLVQLQDNGRRVSGLWLNKRSKAYSACGCSHMTQMIYQTNSEVMVTVMTQHRKGSAVSFQERADTSTAASSTGSILRRRGSL